MFLIYSLVFNANYDLLKIDDLDFIEIFINPLINNFGPLIHIPKNVVGLISCILKYRVFPGN